MLALHSHLDNSHQYDPPDHFSSRSTGHQRNPATMTEISRQELSSPDQSPQHPWPMVPVLQTLTVLSDGEEELMEQKMGIENGYMGVQPKLDPLDPVSFNLQNTPQTQKRKVGRPVTSLKTMNRSFPAVDEIRGKLEAGECYVRPRASSSSSDVWALFQEVAYKDTHFFTGIVQCKSCKFLTRYHGQITGTSHMRRHHCFSLLFPNSMPATRKAKSATNQAANGGANGLAVNISNVDADSTTPRMLKKMKKEMSPSRSLKQSPLTNIESFNQFFQQLPLSGLNGASLQNNSNLTIHPSLPKKRHKNNQFVSQERSLMASNNGSYSQPVNSISPVPGVPSNNNSSSQSMLRPVNNNNNNSHSSPSSSPHNTMSNNQQQQQQQSPNLNVPSSVTNNLRIQNSKQDLRERLVQFCCQELVPINSVNSEAFRAILQSHLRLCTTQLHQQLFQQQQQHPQLMTLTAMVSSYMNHLSHQMPDSEQLRTYLELLYGQCRDKIRQDLSRSLETNVGGALVCDSEQDACIISVYYVDSDWRLVEAVLSASAVVYDINKFVTQTLGTYNLQDGKKLQKFTFVSHGGLFDGVSLCLGSMSHIVDKVIDEAFSSADELFQSKKLPLLSSLFDNCQELIAHRNLPVESSPYDVDWITKYNNAKAVLQHRAELEADLDMINFDIFSQLIDLLEPFRTASLELRQCFKHPTLSHVLLYFYKLKKVLSSSSVLSFSRPQQLEPTNLSKKNAKVNGNDVNVDSPPPTPKKSKKVKLSDKTEPSATPVSSSEFDSDEEKEIEPKKDAKPKTNGEIKHEEDKEMTEVEKEHEEEEEPLEESAKLGLMVDHLKKFLMENLLRYYQVQSLHRIATFLWPNFRFLKMLSSAEQKEVHEEVRKLLQTRVLSGKGEHHHSNSSNFSAVHNNNNNNNGSEQNGNSPNVNGKSQNGNSTNKQTNFDEWEVNWDSDQDQDEVDKYLSVQLTSCDEDHVLQWWREHQMEFPKLSQLAKWILAIPASVTTRERFKINHNRHVDDLTLFLHCNMQNDKFDLNTLRRSQPKKVKHSKNSPVPSSASLIAQPN